MCQMLVGAQRGCFLKKSILLFIMFWDKHFFSCIIWCLSGTSVPSRVKKISVKNIGFLQRRISKELFFLWAARSYWWYLPSKAVMFNVSFVGLLTVCRVSTCSVFLVCMACFHYIFSLSNNGNQTIVTFGL